MRIAISARPRVVLPGAQALLSFGAMLSEAFAPLARSVKACTDFRLLPRTWRRFPRTEMRITQRFAPVSDTTKGRPRRLQTNPTS
jgi:hypothetical protein